MNQITKLVSTKGLQGFKTIKRLLHNKNAEDCSTSSLYKIKAVRDVPDGLCLVRLTGGIISMPPTPYFAEVCIW